jgi:hypothetical protein
MWRITAFLAIVMLGLLLTASAWLFPRLGLGRLVWTEAMAKEHTAALHRRHMVSELLAHSGTKQEIEAHKREYGEANRKYLESKARFDSAESRANLMQSLMRWSGLACVLGGSAGVFLLRDARDS